ncbi:unnamed protein product, partial [Thelazia callipaeda]|uniref:RPN13_C domain-containing protein n=1 Tax=Thelazia callipaeda TaxID=103827 RepID=A0A0N5DAN4_THECL
CKNTVKVNDTLNNPPAPRAAGRGNERGGTSSFGSLAALSGAASDNELGALGNLDQTQLLQLLSLMNHSSGGTSASEAANLLPQLPVVADSSHPVASERSGTASVQVATPSNTPANGTVAGGSSNNEVQLSQLKDIIASITAPNGTGRKFGIDFTDVLCCADKINTIVCKYSDRLIPHLPNQEPTYTSQEELEQTLRTPQFRQAVNIFGHALQTGQLAPVLRQFGINENVTATAGKGDVIAWASELEKCEKETVSDVSTIFFFNFACLKPDIGNEESEKANEEKKTDDQMDLD